MGDLLNRGFTGTADSAHRYGNLVCIEFDLNWPLKDLVKYSKYVLGRAMRNYQEEFRELGLRIPKGRRRFTDYDMHLKIWDLKKRGTPLARIASSVPGVSSLQSVHDHVRAAQRLISGGYKEIR